MNEFNLPEALKVSEIDNYYSRYFLEPLKKGYAETMGNFIKDLLISELPGFSPVSIKFLNIDKKNKKLAGARENILEIVMNIKNIICYLEKGEEYTKKVKVTGKKTLRAGELEDDVLKIKNKDLHLFEVVGKKFEIELTFKKGCGYVLSYEHEKEQNVPFNKFYVDSYFSPVTLVEVDVAPVRIGGDMTKEKLILDLQTNGTLTPKNALTEIVEMVEDRFSIMPPLTPSKEEVKKEKTKKKEAKKTKNIKSEQKDDEEEKKVEEVSVKKEKVDVNEILVLDLELSQRAKNCLKNFPFRRLVDFTQVSADELMRLKNFGQKTLDELREKLAEHGLTLKGETLE
ncbi:MAG: DNA-directed RNA polymerase subunit alpha C-terminal domain-containing protein [Candidatus Muiribacteriota bacterium]